MTRIDEQEHPSHDNPAGYVDEKASVEKLDFLKYYFTKWNQMAKFAPRAIIISNSGTGLVQYKLDSPLLNQVRIWAEYSPSLLAILKTLRLSSHLTIILNEKNPSRYQRLQESIDSVREQGLRIFTRQIKQKVMNLVTKRYKKAADQPITIFPERPNQECPEGYHEAFEKTKASIIMHEGKFEDSLSSILAEDLRDQDVIKRDGTEITRKLICLFMVDAGSPVNWATIEQIGHRAGKQESVELVLGWYGATIKRSLGKSGGLKLIADVYGMAPDQAETEFNDAMTARDFLNKYIPMLKQYWKHIGIVSYSRDPNTRPRKQEDKWNQLLFCTNSDAGWSIAGFKNETMKKSPRTRKFADILSILQSSNSAQ
jgi:hypothetical protein